MNVFSFTGNVGSDAEVRAAGDTEVTGFSVAVRAGYGKREQTIWVRCSMWGKRGSAVAPYLTKGAQVAVTGELSTSEYEGKTNLDVRVNDLTLVGGKSAKTTTQEPRPEPTEQEVFQDDDIPF